MSSLETELDDMTILTAACLCEGDKGNPEPAGFQEARQHYDTCNWCQTYVEQRRRARPYSISDVGWWSGYADRERP